MSTATYQEILRKLGAFFDLCDSLNLRADAEQGRFGIYETRIRHLIAIIEEIHRGVPEGPLFAKVAPELPIFLESLTEALEVGMMTPFLSRFRAEVLAPRIRLVVRGPVLPSDEDSSSNQARNIQFELSLASLFDQAGVTMAFGEPDLYGEINGYPFLVACKRIFSAKKLNTRINEATQQLARHLVPLPEKAGGIVAISLSAVLPAPEGKTVPIASQAEGLKAMESVIETFVDAHRATWQKTREAQGILFHLQQKFTNNQTGKVEHGGFCVIHGTGPIIEGLAGKLESQAKGY